MSEKGVLLIFLDHDIKIFWLFLVDNSQYKTLKYEIEQYNKWIDLLENGLVPLSSYEEPEDANNLLLAKNWRMYSQFESPDDRGYYENFNYRFYLIEVEKDKNELEDEFEEELENFNERSLELQTSTNILINIITKKYISDDIFSMGYRILPMTQYLIDNGRFLSSYDELEYIPGKKGYLNAKKDFNLRSKNSRISLLDSSLSDEISSGISSSRRVLSSSSSPIRSPSPYRKSPSPIRSPLPSYKNSSIPSPKVTTKMTPKVTSKVTPKITPKIMPKITPKMTTKITTKITPKITPKIRTKITPKITPEMTPKIRTKITPEIIPEIIPEITPE